MKRILVVDDDIGALTLVGIMLERGGFQVLKAHDAEEALVTLDGATPDLIILDVMMPGMDGLELCRIIRQRPATTKTPVLILSTKHDMQTIFHSQDVGATDYLPKPILHHDLVTKVTQLMNVNSIANS